MANVVADLTLESEAATVLALRLAGAADRAARGDAAEAELLRLALPAAKFWICKRAVEIAGEAMEVFGGNGYVETGSMARLYREAPVNSIWEGSGNVMCLDVMRAIAREPESAAAWLEGLAASASGDAAVRREIDTLRQLLVTPPEQLEGLGRMLAQRLVLVAQAALLRRASPGYVADAFIATRLGDAAWGRVAGGLDARRIDVSALLARALPH
jgi:putative acyl-CoA dehydrogenase